MSIKRRRMLDIVATDRTFHRCEYRGAEAWMGKCIFCNTRLVIADDGTPLTRATIEHIWPRHHGGDDALDNLALACNRCNREKGWRHDCKTPSDPRLLEVVEGLRARRRMRWRDPP